MRIVFRFSRSEFAHETYYCERQKATGGWSTKLNLMSAPDYLIKEVGVPDHLIESVKSQLRTLPPGQSVTIPVDDPDGV